MPDSPQDSDELLSEEDVKIKFLVPYLEAKGYKKNCIDFNKPIEVQEGRKRKTIFADAVVYTTSTKTAPLIVCETKPPGEPLTRWDTEQAISYARLLPKIAPLVLVTNGAQARVFQSLSKNRLPDLPNRRDLSDDFVRFVVSAETQEALRLEAKHELFIIDDVQSFKSILRACHKAIRNDKGDDATVAFDEMSKVLFCKMHEERTHAGDANRFRSTVFDHSLSQLGVNVVRQIWEETKSDPQYAGLFDPNSTIALDDRTIGTIVSLFENYDLSLTAFDVKGEAFEYFLSDTFTGGLGEYFTPRNVVEFMVDAVDPKIGDKIIDPFCGTGGFLIYAFDVVSEKIRLNEFSEEEKKKWKLELSNRCIFGTDWKERTTLACKMNMIVHGDGSAGIVMHHGLIDVPGRIEEGQFDICITNPPFGSIESDKEVLKKYELRSKAQQDRMILAVERALRLVKPGGMVAIVVMDGILNNDSKWRVRDYIKQHAWVKGVISLPAVTFEGYNARSKTSILLLEKKPAFDETGAQGKTFMAVVENSGYAPNGDPVGGNQLPEVLLDYKAFRRGQESHAHPLSWATTLQDRMDAEFYRKRTPVEPPSDQQIAKSVAGVESRLEKITTELKTTLSDIRNAFADLDTQPVALSDLFVQTKHHQKIGKDTHYRLLGVKWWGLGTFIREEKAGKNIKGSKLNRVSAGDVIYNRLFAFRGSFAIVPPEHADCHVSGEFPTFAVRDDVAEPELVASYVVHCMNSPQYLDEVDRRSTGSTKTSRNRYKEKYFLEMRVAMPVTIAQMRTVVELMDRARNLKQQQTDALADLDDLTKGITRMLPIAGEPSDQTPEILSRRDETLVESLERENASVPVRKKAAREKAARERSVKKPSRKKPRG
jgi:type I restriction enzyme M protein